MDKENIIKIVKEVLAFKDIGKCKGSNEEIAENIKAVLNNDISKSCTDVYVSSTSIEILYNRLCMDAATSNLLIQKLKELGLYPILDRIQVISTLKISFLIRKDC